MESARHTLQFQVCMQWNSFPQEILAVLIALSAATGKKIFSLQNVANARPLGPQHSIVKQIQYVFLITKVRPLLSEGTGRYIQYYMLLRICLNIRSQFNFIFEIRAIYKAGSTVIVMTLEIPNNLYTTFRVLYSPLHQAAM